MSIRCWLLSQALLGRVWKISVSHLWRTTFSCTSSGCCQSAITWSRKLRPFPTRYDRTSLFCLTALCAAASGRFVSLELCALSQIQPMRCFVLKFLKCLQNISLCTLIEGVDLALVTSSTLLIFVILSLSRHQNAVKRGAFKTRFERKQTIS